MPLREQRFDFQEEIDRLEAECREVAERLASLDDSNPKREELLEEGQSLDAQLAGVRWAVDAHDDEAVPVWDAAVDGVRLGGLTGGEFGRVEDDLRDGGGGGGMVRVLMVARGTLDAPYVDDGMSDKEVIGATSSLPLTFLKWAQARVNEMTTVGGNGEKRFGDFLDEARATETSSSET